MRRPNENRIRGTAFENAFERLGTYQGFLIVRNPLSSRFLKGGTIMRMKSNLDYTVIDKSGRTAFVDCKNYQNEFFTFSQINKRQIERAIKYEEFNLVSGFVCWFRSVNRIGFFSGTQVFKAGKGTRFSMSDAVDLGCLESLRLETLFKVKVPATPVLVTGT